MPGSLRLHLNEHTGGCSPRVLERLRSLEATTASLYPDYAEAISASRRWFGVSDDEFVLTNGMDEGIFAASILALRGRADAEGIVVEPAFEVYDACVRCVAGQVVRVTMPADFTLRADDVLRAATPRTRIAFLNTPHNPSGACISHDVVEEIAAGLPDALVFVDEAYVEFAGDTFTGRAPWSRNILVGRTFAKAFGLAGLRLGAVIGPPEVVAELKAIVPPFSINSYAAAALVEALEDEEFVRGYITESAESRELLYEFCVRHGLYAFPSAANFVLIRVGPRAKEISAALSDRGILVRDRSDQANCGGCIRITAGLREHTRAALDALEGLV
jgi:histidinol-phosphate aminotransferase